MRLSDRSQRPQCASSVCIVLPVHFLLKGASLTNDTTHCSGCVCLVAGCSQKRDVGEVFENSKVRLVLGLVRMSLGVPRDFLLILHLRNPTCTPTYWLFNIVFHCHGKSLALRILGAKLLMLI